MPARIVSPFIALAFACALVPAIGAELVELLRCDFSKESSDRPFLDMMGEARIEDGVLKTSPLANWQRSGLNVGPVAIGDGDLTVEYDVRPVKPGRQCQEFTSQSPSTHWYMIYVGPDGRIRLHTRLNGEWKLRAESSGRCEVGKWYHVTVSLGRRKIAYRIADRETGAELWQSGPIEMDNIGAETAFALTDEGATAGEGASEWDNLTIKSDDKALVDLWAAKQEELRKEKAERLRREEQTAVARKAGICIIPMPQEIHLTEGAFRLSGQTRIAAVGGATDEAVSVVQDVLAERLGIHLAGGEGGILVSLPSEAGDPLWRHEQSYRLAVIPEAVRIEAGSPAGFFYAAQTLAQLGRGGKPLPAMEVRDWPGIRTRLTMIAVSQGAFQVIDVEYWKRIIRELAAVKMNAIMPYFEGGTFYYEKYPFLALKGRDGFTVEKGKVLSEYARKHFVEILPQQQSFGHSGITLGHKETKHLRESGGVFCSTNPDVLVFLGDLYDELVQAFPYARYIHVGGDEFAQGFAQCPRCRARSEQIGKDGLYAEYLMKLRELLAKRKRGTMIWWHEQGFTESAANRLAKDIVIFDWHYGNQREYPSLDRLMKLGFAQTWATPAVTRYYNSHANDWYDTFGNIQGFMRAGLKRNVPGQCTCTWVHGIWGGRNLFELNLYGLLFSAECSWNPLSASDADFRRKFAEHWLGLGGESIEEEVLHAVHAPFGEPKEQKFWRDCRALEPILGGPPKATAKLIQESPGVVDEARELIRFCDRADAVLDRWLSGAQRNKATVEFLKHDVRIHRAAARRILCIQDVMRWRDSAAAAAPGNRPAVSEELIRSLGDLVADYKQIEEMFKRSVKEAGGGECVGKLDWMSVARGGIWFRAVEGREGIEKLIESLRRGDYEQAL